MIQKQYRDVRGTVTIKIRHDIDLFDTDNGFHCYFPIDKLGYVLEKFKRYEHLVGEVHSTEIINTSWFNGNYIKRSRIKEYIKYLTDTCQIDYIKIYNPSSLKRMSITKLIEVDNKLSTYSILQKTRKEVNDETSSSRT